MRKFFSNKLNLFLVLLVGALIFILLVSISFLEPVRSIFLKVINPFQAAAMTVTEKVTDFLGTIGSVGKLQVENKDLKKQIGDLKVELAKLNELKNENEILKRQLGFSEKQNFKLIPAQIINFSPQSFLNYFVIDKGSQDGLKEGMAVTRDGILVGKLAEVQNNTAKVVLITDPTSSTTAIVQNSRATGVIKGQIGGGLEMEMIPQSKVIKQGDLVVTSALGKDFPKAILIGQIMEVKSNPNELFQKASIISPLNFKDLEMVFIIVSTE